MVIFYSYVSLPEGNPWITVLLGKSEHRKPMVVLTIKYDGVSGDFFFPSSNSMR